MPSPAARLRLLLLCSLTVIVASAANVFAQTITAEISGVITDQSGGVVPGAVITIKNLDTGASRVVTTDKDGRYRAPQLSVGNYQLQVESSGFRTELRSGINLTVGREAVVNFTLTVGEARQQITVTADAPLVNTTSGGLSNVVDEKTIRDLPLNSRSFAQLALLEPGVQQFTQIARTRPGNQGIQLSINGARPTSNVFFLDGTEVMDATNKTPGSTAGVFTGVEAVREFEVLTNSYGAQYGRSSGGVINVVTKSGTNALHGSVFEFLRNDNLDARNFFDPGDPPEFTRNQFGFALGGPIKKDRSFFFGTFEGLRERLGITQRASVPSVDARRGLLPAPGQPGVFENVGVAASVQPYLALYPLPNGRDFGDGTAELISPFRQTKTGNFFQIRFDQNFPERFSLFARYTFDDAHVLGPAESVLFPLEFSSRNQYVTLGLQNILTPNLVNSFRLSYTRPVSARANRALIPLGPALSFLPGERMGEIRIGGIMRFGFGGTLPEFDAFNTYQLSEAIVFSKGKHSIEAGLLIDNLRINLFLPNSNGGGYFFPGLRQFLTSSPTLLTIDLPGSVLDRAYRETIYGIYFQDNLRIRQGLSVNLGLRYEPFTVPSDTHGRTYTLRDIHDAEPTRGPLFRNPSLGSLAPRVGFAWDLTGDAKAALRGGFGLFYEPINGQNYLTVHWTLPLFRLGGVPNPRFPRADLADASVSKQITTLDYNLEHPYRMSYNLNLQTEAPRGGRFTVGYVGSRGINQLRAGEINTTVPETLADNRLFFPQGNPRVNPNFASVELLRGDGDSWYNSLQLSWVRRFARGFQFQTSYTFSKNIDTGSSTFSSDTTTGAINVVNPYQNRFEKGLSAFHIGQNVTFNLTYELPRPGGTSGIVGAVLNGWTVNSIGTFQSGVPFDVTIQSSWANTGGRRAAEQRPDLRPGRGRDDIILGGPDKYFDRDAFILQSRGTFGNFGRNVLTGPGLSNVDCSLVKNAKLPILGEAGSLQFRAEFFNILNHANFAVPSFVTFAGGRPDEAPLGSAGRITGTVTSSRQIQFGMKILF